MHSLTSEKRTDIVRYSTYQLQTVILSAIGYVGIWDDNNTMSFIVLLTASRVVQTSVSVKTYRKKNDMKIIHKVSKYQDGK